MPAPPAHEQEDARIAALLATGLLDTPPEERFNRFARLAAAVLKTPIALVNLVDADRVQAKANLGFGQRDTPRNETFCAHAIHQPDLLLVENAPLDPRFADNPHVIGPSGIRAYAGVPLRAPGGLPVGTLCVVDTVVRNFGPEELELLRDIAGCTEELIHRLMHDDLRAHDDTIRAEVHQKEQQLTHQRAFLERVLNTTVTAITVVDEAGIVTYANPAAEAVLGLSPSELQGQPYEAPAWRIEAIDGRPFPSEQLPFSILRRTGGPVRGVRHGLRWPDGRRRYVSVNGERLEGPFEGAGRYIFSVADITDLIEVRNELSAQQKKLDQLMERVPGALYECELHTDGTLTFPYASANFWKLMGETPIQVPADDVQAFRNTTPEDAAEMIRRIAHSAQHLEPFQQEFRVPQPDGRMRWVEANAQPERQPDGGTRWYGYLDDVTERKEVALALEEREERLRALFELSPIGIALNEAKTGRFLAANSALLQQTGYNETELLNTTYWDLTPPEYYPQEAAQFEAFFSAGRYGPYEKEYIRKDGSRYPVRLQGTLIRASSGELLIWSLIQDISDARRVEELQREFLSTVSHELRTPLTSIAGALGLLCGKAAGDLPAQANQLLEVARRNTQRLRTLVDDLLDMEKLIAGKVTLHPQPLSVPELMREVVELQAPFGAPRGVSLRLDESEPSQEVSLRADRERLLQVLANLLSNATKFTPDHGEVEVGWTATNDTVTLFVRDHGSGIPLSFQPRIFERFAQADSGDTRAQGGTGLGLSIARELVVQMGGEIDFESTEGVGTIFRVTLPRVR